MVSALGHGVYEFSEAAKFTRLRISRIREWFRIRQDRPPIFRGDYAPINGKHSISFLDLIDVFIAGQLRDHGVSLQTLRKVYRKLSKDFDTMHPFSRKELLSDGKIVFTRGLNAKGQEEIQEALTNQLVFPQIILPFLKQVDYDMATSLALRWRIADQIVLDPEICFGKPVVEKTGIPTYILAAAYIANDKDEILIANWYKVKPSHVLAAVQFETTLAA
jgi:uncharacterized protein (DUF433 family)